MLLGLTTVPPGAAHGRAWRIDCSPGQEYHWVLSFPQSKVACFLQEARGGWCSSQGLLRFHMLWCVPPVLRCLSLQAWQFLPSWAPVASWSSRVREPVCGQGGVELDAFPVLAICLGVCRFPSPFIPHLTFLLDVLRL